MPAPNLPTRELAVSLHVVESAHQIQVARRSLARAREALAGVDGVDDLWLVLQARCELLDELLAQLNTRAQSPAVRLAASHSGTGCPMCEIADPLNHPRCVSIVNGEQCAGRAHVDGGLCDVCIAEIGARAPLVPTAGPCGTCGVRHGIGACHPGGAS